METKMLNWQDGLNRLLNNKDLYVTLLNKFITSQQDIPQQLAAALAAGDKEKLCFEAHTIKGVAANLGAEALADVARQLELTVKKGEDPADDLAKLAAIMQQTLTAMRAFCAS